MALHEIELESNAKDVAVNFSSSRIAVLHERTISVFRFGVSPVSEPVLERKIDLPEQMIPLQICFRGDEDVFVLLATLVTGFKMVYNAQSNYSHEVKSPGPVRIFAAIDHTSLCIAEGNIVSELRPSSENDPRLLERPLHSHTICIFPYAGPWIESIELVHHAEQVSTQVFPPWR